MEFAPLRLHGHMTSAIGQQIILPAQMHIDCQLYGSDSGATLPAEGQGKNAVQDSNMSTQGLTKLQGSKGSPVWAR